MRARILADGGCSSFCSCQVDTIKADAAAEEEVEALVERAIKDEGRLDVFFANAGIAPVHMLEGTDASDIANVLRVNTIGPFLAVKYASEAMKQTSSDKQAPGGSIILTASVAGLNSGAGFIDYSASKAAVISMAKTSAWELGGTGIRVNAVCPGLIETGENLCDVESAGGFADERPTLCRNDRGRLQHFARARHRGQDRTAEPDAEIRRGRRGAFCSRFHLIITC